MKYTAWGHSAGAAVLTGAAQAYNEAQAVSQLNQRIAEQRGAVWSGGLPFGALEL